MSYLSIFKRIIPFFLTFAAGLLIASIFIPIGKPNFQRPDRGGKGRHHRELRKENENLRRENDRMRQELEAMRQEIDAAKFSNLDFAVPYVRVEAPVPPPPPARVVR
ncbi:MAG: hypothetical protein ABL984_16645 [Pyrinomonadaceae bacterium]